MKSGNLMIEVLHYDGDDRDPSGAHATVRLRLVIPASIATLLRQTTSGADVVEFVEERTIASLHEWLDQHASASALCVKMDTVMSDLCPGAWKTLKRSKDSLADLQCGVNFIK
jgi:hypothetical protein